MYAASPAGVRTNLTGTRSASIMTRTSVATFVLALAALVSSASGQAPSKVLSGAAPKDTVVILTFDLYNGGDGVAGQAVTLNHTLAGKLPPSHFRVSRFADFRDATWQVYPVTIPRWTSASFEGSCRGVGVARLVAYFQVRASKDPLQNSPPFAMSNVARDTACVVIGG